MKRRSIAIGPGAASLILIVVTLSMSVLGMLTLISARNDRMLSERSAEITTAVYGLYDRAETALSELDAILSRAEAESENEEDYFSRIEAALPGEMTLSDGEIFWQEQDGNRILECAVRVGLPGSAPRVEWTVHQLVVEMEDFDGIWN